MNSYEYQFDPKVVQRFLSDYQDRGMVKWQGFYLSDHTQRIERDAETEWERAKRIKRPAMTTEKITSFIEYAVQKRLKVAVQMNWTNRNQHIPDLIVGPIEGKYQNRIMVGTKLIVIGDICFIEKDSEV